MTDRDARPRAGAAGDDAKRQPASSTGDDPTLLSGDHSYTSMGGTDAAPAFRTALRDAVRLRDCLALAAVPLVVLGVYTLPVATRRGLAFAYHDPTLATAYTAHFVHFEAEHLAANILGYVLLAGFGYVLAVLAGQRQLFGAAAVTYVIAFPPVLSALNLAVPRTAIGYGFSGVNMAFAGVLGLLLVAYAGRRIDRRVRVRHAPGVFFAAVAVVSLVALPVDATSVGIAAASALVAVVYAASGWRDLRRTAANDGTAARARGVDSTAGYEDVGVLAAVVFFGYPFVGFPSPAAVDGSIVNLYVHLLGFCLGFIVPYVAVETGLFAAEAAGTPPADGDAADAVD